MTTAAVIKTVIGLVLAAFLFMGGRACGMLSSARTITEKNAALQAASQSLNNAALALRDVNAKAEIAKKAEQDQQRRADDAVSGATKDARAYERRIDSIAVELEKAKRQPTCRAQLESELCVPLQ